MCQRIRLLVQLRQPGHAVQRVETHDVVGVALGTSLETLELGIRDDLDPEQVACALSLWGDDNYERNFLPAGDGFFISCTSLR
jgi:hypothetical protein